MGISAGRSWLCSEVGLAGVVPPCSLGMSPVPGDGTNMDSASVFMLFVEGPFPGCELLSGLPASSLWHGDEPVWES